jgi:hypothetical protein
MAPVSFSGSAACSACHLEPVVRVAGERDLAHRGGHRLATAPAQALRLAGQQAVAAAGRLAHHREGRILVGLEAFQRVGDEQQFHGGILQRP